MAHDGGPESRQDGLRLYLDGTQEWLAVGLYPVSLPKRIRLRFTAAGESWGPATLRFPVGDYRWGEDFGAVPDLLPVFASEAGRLTTAQDSVRVEPADIYQP